MKVRFLMLMLLVSCVNHDVRDPAKDLALRALCDRCGKPVSEMFWFQELVDKTDEEQAWQGSIYAGTLDGITIIMHQPLISSCFGCRFYDCDGNRLTLTTQQAEIVIEQMTTSNLIYTTSFE